MKSPEKRQIPVTLEYRIDLDGDSLDWFVEKIKKWKDTIRAQPDWIENSFYFDVDHGYGDDPTEINIVGLRWETDKEFQDRIDHERKIEERKKAAEAKKKRELKQARKEQEEKERALYETLKKKYG